MTSMNQRLKDARIMAGISSAKQAAAKFGWNPSTYNAHENGQNDYNAEWAQEYAKAFRTSAEWLLFGREPTIPERTEPPQAIRDEPQPGIDAQLKTLPPEASKRLISEFNNLIRGAKIALGKLSDER